MAGDVTAQTERILENIKGILESAGTSLAYAVENFCFLADVRRDFAAFNAVYGRYFDTNGPTRTTVQAVLPRDGLLVEIRCLMAMPPAWRRRRLPGRAAPRGSPEPSRRAARVLRGMSNATESPNPP